MPRLESIDPIDSNRNLAAAVSEENIGKFVMIARAFQERPSLRFFKNRKPATAKKHWNNVLIVKFAYRERSSDMIWGQIKRASATLSTQLGLGGFQVIRSGSFADQKADAYLFFLLEETKISKTYALVGSTAIGKVAILGKGHVGVVVLAKRGSVRVALKIRRMDSQRDEMKRESRLLELVNTVGVGPKMIDSSRNFLVMEYLDGIKISKWVKQLSGTGSSRKLKTTIREVLEDCHKLDMLNFDHGELSDISRHVIVGSSKTSLIDFESSSTERRPSNVTSTTQAIYIGSGIAKNVQKIYKNPSKADIIEALRDYKKERTRESFKSLLKVLKL